LVPRVVLLHGHLTQWKLGNRRYVGVTRDNSNAHVRESITYAIIVFYWKVRIVISKSTIDKLPPLKKTRAMNIKLNIGKNKRDRESNGRNERENGSKENLHNYHAHICNIIMLYIYIYIYI
jgi:hypothetical protein